MNKGFRVINVAIILILFLSFLQPSGANAAATTIIIDGYDTVPTVPTGQTAGEWSGLRYLIWDKNEDEVPDYVDVEKFYSIDDTNNIYFRIDTYAPPPYSIGSTASMGYIKIFIDADNNANTGCDDDTNHPNVQGFESYLNLNPDLEIIGVKKCNYDSINKIYSWPIRTTNISATASMAFGQFIEISAPKTALNLPATLSTSPAFYFFFDGGDTNKDDEVPDAGAITLITFGALKATSKSNGVSLTWDTLSEMDTAGFNVLRSESADGPFTQINTNLIPAEGGPTQPASYEYLDQNVQAGITYYYKVEDLDSHGVSTLHPDTPVHVLYDPSFWLYLPILQLPY